MKVQCAIKCSDIRTNIKGRISEILRSRVLMDSVNRKRNHEYYTQCIQWQCFYLRNRQWPKKVTPSTFCWGMDRLYPSGNWWYSSVIVPGQSISLDAKSVKNKSFFSMPHSVFHKGGIERGCHFFFIGGIILLKWSQSTKALNVVHNKQ